jgi:hypothetical protein
METDLVTISPVCYCQTKNKIGVTIKDWRDQARPNRLGIVCVLEWSSSVHILFLLVHNVSHSHAWVAGHGMVMVMGARQAASGKRQEIRSNARKTENDITIVLRYSYSVGDSLMILFF